MKTEGILMWGIGGFIVYKFFIAPKAATTALPSAVPVTAQTSTAAQTSTTALITSGGNALTNIIQKLVPSQSTAVTAQAAPVATVQSGYSPAPYDPIANDGDSSSTPSVLSVNSDSLVGDGTYDMFENGDYSIAGLREELFYMR